MDFLTLKHTHTHRHTKKLIKKIGEAEEKCCDNGYKTEEKEKEEKEGGRKKAVEIAIFSRNFTSVWYLYIQQFFSHFFLVVFVAIILNYSFFFLAINSLTKDKNYEWLCQLIFFYFFLALYYFILSYFFFLTTLLMFKKV